MDLNAQPQTEKLLELRALQFSCVDMDEIHVNLQSNSMAIPILYYIVSHISQAPFLKKISTTFSDMTSRRKLFQTAYTMGEKSSPNFKGKQPSSVFM